MTSNQVVDPIQQRHANKLGFGLGAVVILFIVVCIIMFSNFGLPKDPKEYKRLQLQEADKGVIGAGLSPQNAPQNALQNVQPTIPQKDASK